MNNQCKHPYWRTESDGHTEYWYICTACGHETHVAPWSKTNNNYDDIGL